MGRLPDPVRPEGRHLYLHRMSHSRSTRSMEYSEYEYSGSHNKGYNRNAHPITRRSEKASSPPLSPRPSRSQVSCMSQSALRLLKSCPARRATRTRTTAAKAHQGRGPWDPALRRYIRPDPVFISAAPDTRTASGRWRPYKYIFRTVSDDRSG